MIDTQAIRNKILDLAMRGQLTEQLPEDGDAEELYEQIRDEKDQLIKERKLKKEKSLPPVNDEEVPFPIPDNWRWVRLLKITKKITDGTHHSPVNTEIGDFMYVTAKNIKENGVDLSNITFVSEDIHQEIYSRCNPEKNDVLLIKDGATTGIVTVNNLEEPFSMLSSVALIKPLSKVMPWYIAYAMRSPWFAKYIRGEMTGVGITRVVLKQIETFLIPLPPLAEQQRIVEKTDQAFTVLDTIDALQAQYADNLTTLKAKLIDAAIQGKLTEQLLEDGTAEELYQQIQTEKQTLTKAGIIKKEKPLPEITEDEIPFEIPENWKWVTLGNITTKITSGSTPTGGRKSNVYVESGFPLFREQNIYDDGIHQAGMVFITEELLNTRQNSTVLAKDILLNITGGSIGRCAIVPDNFDRGSINQHILIIRTVDPETRFYIHMLICSPYVQSYIKNNAVGDKDGFSGGRCKKILVPLPPLNEQKRIVETLDRLLSNMGQ